MPAAGSSDRLLLDPMKRKAKSWTRLSGWTIPLTYACLAMIVGMVFPRLESRFLPNLVSSMSAPAALAICSSIASGMLALTGIVFSLTFVMVQFSATAYSPRLVIWLSRDPAMAHALGTFSATFLYALTMIAWVDRGASGKVPLISCWAVVVLLLGSMGMFIALIQRVGLLQINRMLVFTGDQGRRAIDETYPAALSSPIPPRADDHRKLPLTATITHFGRPRAVQAVRVDALLGLATTHDVTIEVAVAVGDTVLEMTPLARVYGVGQAPSAEQLSEAIELGEERTFEQDPKYALRLVVDIAIKALSPAINDPTTAVQALDQIEDLLLRLGQRRLEIGSFCDTTGVLRVVMPFPSWEDLLRLAFDEICYYGAQSVQVMRRMKALIKSLLVVLPTERHTALREWDRRLQGSIARSFEGAEEKQEASVADRQGLGVGQQGGASPQASASNVSADVIT